MRLDMSNNKRMFFVALVTFASFSIADAVQAQAEEHTIDFGLRVQGGGRHAVRLFAENDCKTPHTVTFAVTKGSWLKIAGSTTVQVPPDEDKSIQAAINLKGLKIGKHSATVTLSCKSCGPQCAQSSTTKNAIVIVANSEFGADPADGNFAGLVNGKPVDAAKWLPKVVKDIKQSSFGSTSRGTKIIKCLENKYLDNNLSDITLVPTVDRRLKDGRMSCKTPAVDGETTRPGNASYVRQRVVAMTEEIYIGIDQSLVGITEARKSPADYYAFTYKGRLSVLKKASFVHTIIHEGLHAVQEGKYNLARRGCLEEEQDAFKAGNEAAKALNPHFQFDSDLSTFRRP